MRNKTDNKNNNSNVNSAGIALDVAHLILPRLFERLDEINQEYDEFNQTYVKLNNVISSKFMIGLDRITNILRLISWSLATIVLGRIMYLVF